MKIHSSTCRKNFLYEFRVVMFIVGILFAVAAIVLSNLSLLSVIAGYFVLKVMLIYAVFPFNLKIMFYKVKDDGLDIGTAARHEFIPRESITQIELTMDKKPLFDVAREYPNCIGMDGFPSILVFTNIPFEEDNELKQVYLLNPENPGQFIKDTYEMLELGKKTKK